VVPLEIETHAILSSRIPARALPGFARLDQNPPVVYWYINEDHTQQEEGMTHAFT